MKPSRHGRRARRWAERWARDKRRADRQRQKETLGAVLVICAGAVGFIGIISWICGHARHAVFG